MKKTYTYLPTNSVIDIDYCCKLSLSRSTLSTTKLT